MRVAVTVVAIAFCLGGTTEAGELVRHPREDVAVFAKRLLPADSEFAAKAVDLKLGSLGKIVVLLFRPARDTGNYVGWVLAPSAATASTYRKLVLPPLMVADGRFQIDVKSVFAADVDGDGAPELCVLSQYYQNGSGEDPYFATDFFRWNTDHFDRVDEASPKSIDLKNAKAVRTRFAQHPVKTPAAK